MINKTITQRLNELELNENRLEASRHEKKSKLLDDLVVFAKQEKDNGTRRFWQILEKWAREFEESKRNGTVAGSEFVTRD